MASTTEGMTGLPAPLRVAVGVSVVAALGNLLLAIAHTGVDVALFSALGPEGRNAVPPAVVAFGVATVLFGALAIGLARGMRAAWLGGIALCVLSVLSGIGQFRGVVSAVGIGLSVVLLGLLLTPTARDAMRT